MIIKGKTVQRYIYKINSDRFKREDWELSLSIEEAILNDELISLSDSQLFRFIDELRKRETNSNSVNIIREEIENLKTQYSNEPSIDIKDKIKGLYNKMHSTLFVPEYICLVMDDNKDYEHAYNNGIKLNGISFKRLLGTSNGVKKSEIVFIENDIWEQINIKIDNGRNHSVALIPAKLEAYKALVCSSSTIVSNPKRVIIVPDCKTTFKSDAIVLNDADSDEPVMSIERDKDIELNDSDGYGLILPSLSKRWTEELGGTGIRSGFCIRNSWCKGMCFSFDFQEFAKRIYGGYIVYDIWGNKQDIRQAEMILTKSMLKLWNCYENMDHYLDCCVQNCYSFSVAKVTPPKLENERRLNYQFLQSYDLTDQEIDDLIQPTIAMIQDVMGGDYRKAILFLKGINLDGDNILDSENDVGKALMICQDVIGDPHVQTVIEKMIKKTITEAKIGKLYVHGNYSLVSGDCYALCQSMFGLHITGLLKAGEVYNKYWVDSEADEIVCFRPPMSSHNNIRKLKVSRDDNASYWYRYMPAVTILNSWDTTAHALNGLDKDGDQVFLTDNPILLKNTVSLLAVICEQRQAEKKIVEENDLYSSNIAGKGDEIGKTTNRITAMFDVRSKFPPESDEYKVLSKRIVCGQLYQQNAIDKTKGILAKNMPWHWYSETKGAKNGYSAEFLNSITANKKPYFMRYVYPKLQKKYIHYIDNVSCKCKIQFGKTLDEIVLNPEKTDHEVKFLQYYRDNMPVSTGDCLINKICQKVEKIFDNKICKASSKQFDFSIYKGGVYIDDSLKEALMVLYNDYVRCLQNYMRRTKYERIDDDQENQSGYEIMKMDFRKKCDLTCPDKQVLCDILLDICYLKKGTKQFVWDLCGETIIENLRSKSEGVIFYPQLSDKGDFEYGGNKFIMVKSGGESK